MKLKLGLVLALMMPMLLIGISTLAEIDRGYRNGSVWRMAFIRVKSGMDASYLSILAKEWKQERETLKKAGLILSYKVLITEPHSTEDWNLVLMTEFKNLTVLESEQARREAIIQQISGNDQQQTEGFRSLDGIRQDIGYRIAREIVFVDEK